MPTVTKKYAHSMRKHQGITAYGNLSAVKCTFETNASGVFVDSDQATAVIVADVVRLGPVLPAGMEIHDMLAIISSAFTALTTAKVGFAYVDGVDDPDVPQDDDYFAAAMATSAQARLRASNNTVKPVVLPKDAYVTLTVAGAAHASAGRMDLLITGIMKGVE